MWTYILIAIIAVILIALLWLRRRSMGIVEVVSNPSFAKDIRPLFNEVDITSMKAIRGFDLSNYDDVKKHSDSIYKVVSSGTMPCYGPWNSTKVQQFKNWMDTGMTA